MAITYDEKTKSYTRLNDKGQAMGTVYKDDSLGRYDKIAAEYRAQQGQSDTPSGQAQGNQATPAEAVQPSQTTAPSGYDLYKATAEQYNNALKAAAKEREEQQVQQMARQLEAARQNTEDANAQAYAAKMISEKNIGQQLAAAGLGNGSMTESSRLQNELNWQNAVNENNRQLALAEQNINDQIAAYRADSAQQLAAQDYELAQQLNQVYLQQLAADKEDQRYADELAYQRERDQIADQRYDQQWAYQQAQDAYNQQATRREDARTRIAQYLSAGGSLSSLNPDLISASGLTSGELQTLSAALRPVAQTTATSTRNSGTRRTGGTAGTTDTTGGGADAVYSESAKKILTGLESMYGSISNQKADSDGIYPVEDSILFYCDEGLITDDEAVAMLRHFGYDPSKHFTDL